MEETVRNIDRSSKRTEATSRREESINQIGSVEEMLEVSIEANRARQGLVAERYQLAEAGVWEKPERTVDEEVMHTKIVEVAIV